MVFHSPWSESSLGEGYCASLVALRSQKESPRESDFKGPEEGQLGQGRALWLRSKLVSGEWCEVADPNKDSR